MVSVRTVAESGSSLADDAPILAPLISRALATIGWVAVKLRVTVNDSGSAPSVSAAPLWLIVTGPLLSVSVEGANVMVLCVLS